MTTLAQQLAAHPKWRWQRGMRYQLGSWLYRASREDDPSYHPECMPCLDDPATKGWLLHMLREATDSLFATTVYTPSKGWLAVGYRDAAKGTHHATEGAALASALLAVWGEAQAEPAPKPFEHGKNCSRVTHRVDHALCRPCQEQDRAREDGQ